jgi:hypothetical protein
MLFLPAMLALTSVVVLTPLASPVLPVQSPAVAAAVATKTIANVQATETTSEPKRPLLELPWNNYADAERRKAAMQASLDRFFNVDHSR